MVDGTWKKQSFRARRGVTSYLFEGTHAHFFTAHLTHSIRVRPCPNVNEGGGGGGRATVDPFVRIEVHTNLSGGKKMKSVIQDISCNHRQILIVAVRSTGWTQVQKPFVSTVERAGHQFRQCRGQDGKRKLVGIHQTRMFLFIDKSLEANLGKGVGFATHHFHIGEINRVFLGGGVLIGIGSEMHMVSTPGSV